MFLMGDRDSNEMARHNCRAILFVLRKDKIFVRFFPILIIIVLLKCGEG